MGRSTGLPSSCRNHWVCHGGRARGEPLRCQSLRFCSEFSDLRAERVEGRSLDQGPAARSTPRLAAARSSQRAPAFGIPLERMGEAPAGCPQRLRARAPPHPAAARLLPTTAPTRRRAPPRRGRVPALRPRSRRCSPRRRGCPRVRRARQRRAGPVAPAREPRRLPVRSGPPPGARRRGEPRRRRSRTPSRPAAPSPSRRRRARERRRRRAAAGTWAIPARSGKREQRERQRRQEQGQPDRPELGQRLEVEVVRVAGVEGDRPLPEPVRLEAPGAGPEQRLVARPSSRRRASSRCARCRRR